MLARYLVMLLTAALVCACTKKDAAVDLSSYDPTESKVSQLSLSVGTLTPTFDPAITSYTLALPYSDSSVQLTNTLANPYAVMTVNGNTVTSGSASSAIALSAGANTITVIVTSPDQSTTTTYTIAVTRAAASTDDTLSGLVLSPGALSPAFSASITTYTVLISDLASQVQVTPTGANSGAAIEISWNSGGFAPAVSGQASSSLTPASGTNSMSVRVTSESGSIKTYDITVTHGTCGAGYYDDGTHACVPVTLGYYSPAADNSRIACSNKPSNARYTSPTASSASCPWSCDDGYLTTDGTTCSSYPNATTLKCNDDEVAVGLFGRSGAIADRLGVRCASYSEGSVGITIRNGPYYGGTGGSAFSADCLGNATALEIDGDFATYSGQPRTGRLRFRCKDITTTVLDSFSSYWGSMTGLGAFNYACGSGATPNGSHINGIIIDNAGGASYVGKILGITCR